MVSDRFTDPEMFHNGLGSMYAKFVLETSTQTFLKFIAYFK